jgi:hypothetical protein
MSIVQVRKLKNSGVVIIYGEMTQRDSLKTVDGIKEIRRSKSNIWPYCKYKANWQGVPANLFFSS